MMILACVQMSLARVQREVACEAVIKTILAIAEYNYAENNVVVWHTGHTLQLSFLLTFTLLISHLIQEPFVRLSNSITMPVPGYGTYPLRGATCQKCIAQALKTGYRHFDTAEMYGNEEVFIFTIY